LPADEWTPKVKFFKETSALKYSLKKLITATTCSL